MQILLTSFTVSKIIIGRHRKVVIASVLMGQLSGCVSVDTLVAQNSIRVGMTKTDVANVILWQGDVESDPWLSGCFYEYNRESKCEILSGSGRKQFLVFCGANYESSCRTREGRSTLKGVYRTYNEAKRAAAPVQVYVPSARPEKQGAVPRPTPPPSANDERANAAKIERCTKRGLRPGSPAFKKCFAEN